jgi:hypothetical protein
MAVAVEGDGDRGVAHLGAEGFGVDAGGDRVGGEAVPAFVQTDRSQPGGRPGLAGVECESARVEWFAVDAVAREDEAFGARSLLETVIDQFAPEGFGDRDAAVAGTALGRDEAGVAVAVATNMDQVLRQVDVVPLKRLELPARRPVWRAVA